MTDPSGAWLRRVLWILALLSLASLPMIARALRYGDASAWIGFGCAPPAACFARANYTMLPPEALVYASGGYDGQFYFYLASELSGAGSAQLDSDAFRRSRILMPLLLAPLRRLAGAEALVFGFPALTLLAAFLAMLLVLSSDRSHSAVLKIAAIALNPIALLSLSLSLADWLALSCVAATLHLLLQLRTQLNDNAQPPMPHPGYTLLIAGLAGASAVLAKETALCGALAMAPLLWFSLRRAALQRWQWLSTAVALLPLAVLLLWWRYSGFSLALAATHGAAPFSAWRDYWSAPDALFSGRSLCVLMLPLLTVWSAWTALRLCTVIWRRRSLVLSDEQWRDLAALLCTLQAVFLLSRASAEYYLEFANLARLFLPGAAALACVRFASWRAFRPQSALVLLWTIFAALSFLWFCRSALFGVQPAAFLLEP
ncbi:MAG: hypothetical protein K1X75_10575 [Leptospirales bacterium]|nr:hypothetical protein [Leptospirales bacterium]